MARIETLPVLVGDSLVIGAGHPIVVQTMCNTHTSDVEATVAQVLELAGAGAQMVRITVPGLQDVPHVAAIRALAKERGITVPIFGMVKDDYHKTRALCTDTEEISVARDKAVYTLLYRLQEEVHRFSIRRMSEAKNRTVRRSSLEDIPGVGAAKAKAILAHFGGLAAVRRADVNALCKAPGVGPSLAETIYRHFHGEEKQP